MTQDIASRFTSRLPVWARRGDPRWVLGLAVAAVLIVCCCCGLGFAAWTKRGNDDNHGKSHSRPSAEASKRDSSRPSETPQGGQEKRDHNGDDKSAMRQVPNVVGKNAAVAEDELQQAGFSKVRLAVADGEHKLVLVPQNWEVVKQSASAGSQLKGDAVLVLDCRKVS